MLFKIVHKLVEIDAHDILVLRPSSHATRGHHLRFFKVPTRVNDFLYSFFPSTIKLWNALPDSIVTITNVENFKSNICI